MSYGGSGLRGRLALVSMAVLAMAASTAGATPSPGARAYLDHALALMRANAIYVPHQGWNAVVSQAHRDDFNARDPADEYPQIRGALKGVAGAGDAHAFFYSPAEARRYAPGGSNWKRPSTMPVVSLQQGRYGLVKLPAIGTAPDSRNSRRYEAAALAGIARVSSDRPCGWIVDLRGNVGGNAYPMLLAVGPLLGSGDVMTAVRKNHVTARLTYDGGVITNSSGSGSVSVSFRAPATVADVAPAPPVALLTDWNTASSAEAVAIGFRSRGRTRSFGATTMGATAWPSWFTLSDGAVLEVATHWMADPSGKAPKGPLAADESTNTPLRSAEDWLASTDACTEFSAG